MKIVDRYRIIVVSIGYYILPYINITQIESQIERDSERFHLRLKHNYGAYVRFKHLHKSNFLGCCILET